MGNRALSEVRAAKPVRTCELLQVDPFLFPDVVFYYIGSGVSLYGTCLAFIQSNFGLQIHAESLRSRMRSGTSSCPRLPHTLT